MKRNSLHHRTGMLSAINSNRTLPRFRRLLPLLLAILGCIAPATLLQAEDNIIFQANFSQQETGETPQAQVGRCRIWSGPNDATPWGSGKIVAVKDSNNSSRNAAGLVDASSEKNAAPTLILDAPNFFSQTGPDLEGVVHLKLLVPVEGDYGALINFGGEWKNGALTMLLEKGTANLFNYNNGEHGAWNPFGHYDTNTWADLKVVFHFGKKTFDIWWNEKEVAHDVPWFNQEPNDPFIGLKADITETAHGNEPVLCLAEAEIKLANAPVHSNK